MSLQELKELAALAYRDTTEENREFWKSELSQAIRDIQKEYDNKVDQIRGDMEGFYNLKVRLNLRLNEYRLFFVNLGMHDWCFVFSDPRIPYWGY